VAPWLFLTILILTAACDTSPQAASESGQVNNQQTIYSTNQPLHKYDYSPERDELQQIYDARMKVANTWTVVYSMGKPIFVCPSKGYPIPYTTQLTNPSQVDYNANSAGGNVAIPQSEPNGLYTGQSSATWVLCIRNGQLEPVYAESDAIAFPYPVTIAADGSVQDAGGSSSVQISVKSKQP